jgi:hypothetical protein
LVSGSRSPQCCFHLKISVPLQIFNFRLVLTVHTGPARRTNFSCAGNIFAPGEQRPISSSHSGAVPAPDFIQVSCAPKIRLLHSIFHRRVASSFCCRCSSFMGRSPELPQFHLFLSFFIVCVFTLEPVLLLSHRIKGSSFPSVCCALVVIFLYA